MYTTANTWENVWLLMPPGQYTQVDYLEWLQTALWQSTTQGHVAENFLKKWDLHIVVPAGVEITDLTPEGIKDMFKSVNTALPGTRKCHYLDKTNLEGLIVQGNAKNFGIVVSNKPIGDFPFANDMACRALLGANTGLGVEAVVKQFSTFDHHHTSAFHQNYPIMQVFYEPVGCETTPHMLQTSSVKHETTFGVNSASLCVCLRDIKRPVYLKKTHGGFNFEFLH
jgi:hypothetical protein